LLTALPLIATEAPALPRAVSRRLAPALCITLLSILYLAPACVRAAREKLWFDEILTFDAASLLPSMQALWSFLKQGFEVNPPLGFLLTAGSESLFGRNEFGLRLPSVIAFWVMALCLYVFLRRRLPWQFAVAGMLLPALTAAGRYSYEARPYALVLALAGIALVAWQAAAEGRTRRTALTVLAVALAAALCAQPMAVTLALPFLAGEVARTIKCRRVDWPVWCAFAASTPALLLLWKLKGAGNETAYSRFTGSLTGHIAATYLQMLGPAIAPLGLALVLLVVLGMREAGAGKPASGLRTHELAALAGFALIPFAAVPISILGGHYWLRYSLNSAIGLAGLAATLLFAVGGSRRLAGVTVLAVCGACFAVAQFLPEDIRPGGDVKTVNSSAEVQQFLGDIPADAPIVIGPPMMFVELEHYCGAGLASRLYYLTEPAVAAAIDGEISFEVKGPLLPRFFPFRAHFEDYHAFVAAHKRFYVVRPIRNLAREYLAGRLSLQARETPRHFQYFEATAN
jgi:hypothetical protein